MDYQERATAFVGAIINGTPTPEQVNRIGAAIAYLTDQAEAFEAMGDDARAEFLVLYARSWVLGYVANADARKAALEARPTVGDDLAEHV